MTFREAAKSVEEGDIIITANGKQLLVIGKMSFLPEEPDLEVIVRLPTGQVGKPKEEVPICSNQDEVVGLVRFPELPFKFMGYPNEPLYSNIQVFFGDGEGGQHYLRSIREKLPEDSKGESAVNLEVSHETSSGLIRGFGDSSNFRGCSQARMEVVVHRSTNLHLVRRLELDPNADPNGIMNIKLAAEIANRIRLALMANRQRKSAA
ncbi:MAG: hypothetical protein DCC75_09845 [Proteobacteria bacterium]|nr:MAG: hypothetical protein DCC75_09845 [Pseudomonadota bacterium]